MPVSHTVLRNAQRTGLARCRGRKRWRCEPLSSESPFSRCPRRASRSKMNRTSHGRPSAPMACGIMVGNSAARLVSTRKRRSPSNSVAVPDSTTSHSLPGWARILAGLSGGGSVNRRRMTLMAGSPFIGQLRPLALWFIGLMTTSSAAFSTIWSRVVSKARASATSWSSARRRWPFSMRLSEDCPRWTRLASSSRDRPCATRSARIRLRTRLSSAPSPCVIGKMICQHRKCCLTSGHAQQKGRGLGRGREQVRHTTA